MKVDFLIEPKIKKLKNSIQNKKKFLSQACVQVEVVHEGSSAGEGWGYTLLPSKFPLTWHEARAACEALPGSMLARGK